MPQTLFNEDGTSVEMPTQEEISQQFEKQIRTEYQIPENQTFGDFVKELQESSNPNWKEVREKIKRYEKTIDELKLQGKEINNEGKIVDKLNLSAEEIDKKIKLGVNEGTFSVEKGRLFSTLDDGDEGKKKAVDIYLTKLLSGEEKNIDNLYKYFEEAVRIVYPESTANPLKKSMNVQGKPPLQADKGEKLTEDQKDLGKKLGLSDEDLKDK